MHIDIPALLYTAIRRTEAYFKARADYAPSQEDYLAILQSAPQIEPLTGDEFP